MAIPFKFFHHSKKPTKNNINDIKPKAELVSNTQTKSKKNILEPKNVTKNINENIYENIIKYINENPKLVEKISYLQLWWKTIFQIIKIQKYLRGFLYRVKLLKILENREKIVYGTIQITKVLKVLMYKKVIKKMQNRIFEKQKYYFKIWKIFVTKNKIIKKLKIFGIIKRNKIEKEKNEKKLKSSSLTKRDLIKEKKKDILEMQKMRNKEKNMIKEDLNLSSKKIGLETARINTERNIHNFGFKNSSLEKRKSKKSFKNIFNNNLNNIKSNVELKHQKSNNINKKHCQNHKTSSNLLMNKSQNQLNNYKFINKMKLNNNNKGNQMKLSKKNTNVKKNNIMSKNRNKKNISGALNVDTNLKNYRSYFIESSRNRIKNKDNQNKSIKLRKNYELEYISTHQNRFHCPKQIYKLNKKTEKKNSSIIDKLEMSFELNQESNTLKIDESKTHIRAKSMQNRNKKKYKSFVENIHTHNNNKISKEFNTNKNINIHINNIETSKKEEKKKIIKSKTKLMKKGKKKKSQKGVLKNVNSNTKNKNKKIVSFLNLWRGKIIKKNLLNRIRGISSLNNKLRLYYYKTYGSSFIKYLQNIRKFIILYNYFNRYKNKVNIKIILQKLKENNIKEKEIKFINHNLTESNANNTEDASIKTEKTNIIEISPYQNPKTISKLNHIKNKLKNLLLIKQKLADNIIKKKYIYKWKILNLYKGEPYLKTGNNNMRSYYYDYKKNTEKKNPRNNSSYHRKRVVYKNSNIETSFEDEKVYNRKIVNYLNNNNISVNKDDYINKSQFQINPYEQYNNNIIFN